jgi:putative membrane protein
MMYYGPGMGGWTMALMIFGNVVFWVVLILGAVVIARAFRRGSSGHSGSSEAAPQQLLAERFARGEITEDDFRRSLLVLSETAGPPLR